MNSQSKIKPVIYLSIVITSALFISTLFPSSYTQAKTILVFGDSLSAGYGISYEKAWPSLLNNSLQDTDHKLINASVSGETTSGGLKRLPRLLEEHQPNIVIIELGANDGLRGMPVPGIKSRLTKLVNLAQDADAEVILVGIHLPPNYGPRYNDAFYKSFKDIAEDEKTLLIPFLLKDVATNRALMLPDGLHPNEQAQGIILETVREVLDPLLVVSE